VVWELREEEAHLVETNVLSEGRNSLGGRGSTLCRVKLLVLRDEFLEESVSMGMQLRAPL